MKQIKLFVNTSSQKYPIIIGSNLTTKVSNIIQKNLINYKKCLLVIDKKVPKNSLRILKDLKTV